MARTGDVETRGLANGAMKAIVWTRYGAPEGLRVADVPKPVPRPDEILVRVRVATVTAGDCELRGLRFSLGPRILFRLLMGVTRPRRKILGQELAGEVEAVGADVRLFRPGDRVFGTTGLRFGAYAEFVCLPERSTSSALATIPANVSDEEAAAVPTGGLEALHLLRRAGPLNGRRVQIVGAAGGIGTYAVQLAKAFGGVVTGVDFAGRLPLLRTLGADAVVEAADDGGSSPAGAFEVVFDVVGRGSFRARSRALTPDGVYVLANPNLAGWLRARWPSGAGRRRVVVGATRPSREDLEFLGRSLAEHHLRSPIDRRFPLAEVAAAHRYFESGQARGKVVITVDDGPRRVPAGP